MELCEILILFVGLSFLLSIQTTLSATSESEFVMATHCKTTNCTSALQGIFRSKIECAAECRDNMICSGFNFTLKRECYHFRKDCFGAQVCNYSSSFYKVYERRRALKVCQHGGQLEETSNFCRCVGGYIGDICERLAYYCEELRPYQYVGWNWVKVDILRDRSRLVDIMCFLSVETTTTFSVIMETTGWVSHNKTYQEYVDGYEIDSLNYFLGLENMHILSQRFSLYDSVGFLVALNDSVGTQNYLRWWNFDWFTIDTATNGYRITTMKADHTVQGNLLLSSNQSLGDILGQSQGVPFSTFDNDHDDDATRNCAAESGAGWWFHNCSAPINPLGLSYLYTSGGTPEKHIRLPGINTADPEVVEYFQFILFFFHTQ